MDSYEKDGKNKQGGKIRRDLFSNGVGGEGNDERIVFFLERRWFWHRFNGGFSNFQELVIKDSRIMRRSFELNDEIRIQNECFRFY